jgi:hypothetical protein
MGGMNVGGVVKGGLVAGLVINVGEFILNGVVVADAWAAATQALGIEQGAAAMSVYVIGAFVMGLVGVWLYAAARPRLGAGPATAVKMGLVVWALACLWPIASFMTMGLLPRSLLLISLVWEVVEVPLAIAVGAWLYKEAEA